MQPPWSIAQSTITAAGFIVATMSSVTSTGARPPGTSTAPITRSASATARATAPRLLASVMMRPLWIWSTQRKPIEVLVEQQHLGLHALRDPRRVPADVARAEHDDARGPHAGRAAEQHAAPAVRALEEVRADLRRHAARDLAHRREQRQLPVRELHRLVRDRRSCPRSSSACATSGYAARWRYVNSTRSGRRNANSCSCGSFTLSTSPARSHTSAAARDDLRARAAVVVVGDARVDARVAAR